MLFTLQFPIADSRAFVDFDAGKLNRPLWPVPLVDQDFVRSFGMIRRQWSGGLTGWIGENEICDAHRALRIPRLDLLRLPELKTPIPLKVAFRCFYSDGVAIAKFEVGIALPYLQDQDSLKQIPKQVFDYLLNLPVSIPNPRGKPANCKLWQAGRHLANLYAASSSRTLLTLPGDIAGWLVQPGNPIMIVEYHGLERAKVPFWSKNVTLSKYPDALVSHHIIPMHGLNLRLWMLNSEELPKEEARKLRIALLRIHAEKECLRRILTNLGIGRIQLSPRGGTSDALQDYLNTATRRILRLQGQSAAMVYEPSEDSVVELAFQAEETITPGEKDAILEALRRLEFRKNILLKAEQFVDQSSAGFKETTYMANMESAGLDKDKCDRIIAILAADAANTPPDSKSYFRNLVQKLFLPQAWENQIIGVWEGNTDYDARNLVKWVIGKGVAPGASELLIINLLDIVKTGLGTDDGAFVQGIINTYRAAQQQP